MKIYIASSEKHAGKIQEDIFLRESFISRGVPSEILTLKDIVKISKASDIVILKSIWGYHTDFKRFLEQVSSLKKKKVQLVNDYDFVRWNIYKHKYLNELKKSSIIPTSFLHIGKVKKTAEIAGMLSEAGRVFNTDMLVIKPSVSASGYLTYAYDVRKADDVIVKSLYANKHLDFIVQAFKPSIAKGEISAIVINGNLLYGINRFPGVLSYKREAAYIKLADMPISIKKELKLLKDFFMEKFGALPKICRVDFIEATIGHEILEVELIDPDLFFRYIPENMKKKAFSILYKSFAV